ncbi:MAG: hypothetical protein ABFD52_09940 [Acidobacteriota bacterium]
MAARFAVPFLILAVLFLPLPFVVAFFVFGALLAARPRGEPCRESAALRRPAGPALLRSPPR